MFKIDPNVKLAAAGDMAAFEELYRSHHTRVYSLCLYMTRNASEAEDLTQDIFIQLFRKLHTFRGESSFTTWLHKLTVNTVLMHFRKQATRKESADEEVLPNQTVSATYNPSRFSLLDRISLNEAIRKLSPGYRVVFILHDLEGYKHSQISNILGCAIGTSKSQLHKARQKLRELLRQRRVFQRTGSRKTRKTRIVNVMHSSRDFEFRHREVTSLPLEVATFSVLDSCA